MKKLIVLLLILGLGINQNSAQELDTQNRQSSQELYDFHIQKKKANNLAGWLTLGGGTAMILGGLGWNMSQPILGSSDDNNQGLWLSYLGGAVTLTSIPLFIASGKHKKKAQIQLQNGAVGFRNEIQYSGLSITFAF